MNLIQWLALAIAAVLIVVCVFINYALSATGCDYARTYVRDGVVYVWARDCVPEVVMCDDVERPGCLEAAGIFVSEGGKDLERIR